MYCQAISTFVFLSDDRRLLKLNGRIGESLNLSLDTFIKRIPVVTDAIGDFVVIDGVPYYILQFVESQQTVAVNLINNTWSEWGSLINVPLRWEGSCITFVPAWDRMLIGHINNGYILAISDAHPTERAVGITSLIRTNRIHSGGRVITPTLTLHLTKVSVPDQATTPSMTVRWRDDGKDWVTARTVSLPDSEKTDYVKNLFRLGSYRLYRQYEFDVSNLHPYALSAVEQL